MQFATQFDPDDPRWTAYVLGELDAAEAADVEQELEHSSVARQWVEELRQTIGLLAAELEAEPILQLTAEQRAAIQEQAAHMERQAIKSIALPVDAHTARRAKSSQRWFGVLVAVAASLLVIATLVVPGLQNANSPAKVAQGVAPQSDRAGTANRYGDQHFQQNGDDRAGSGIAGGDIAGGDIGGSGTEASRAGTDLAQSGGGQKANKDALFGEIAAPSKSPLQKEIAYTVTKPEYKAKTKDLNFTVAKPVYETKTKEYGNAPAQSDMSVLSTSGGSRGAAAKGDAELGDRFGTMPARVPRARVSTAMRNHSGDKSGGGESKQSGDRYASPDTSDPQSQDWGLQEGKLGGGNGGGGYLGGRLVTQPAGATGRAVPADLAVTANKGRANLPGGGSEGKPAADYFRAAGGAVLTPQPGVGGPGPGGTDPRGTVVLYDGAQPGGLSQLKDGDASVKGRVNWYEYRQNLGWDAAGGEAYDEVTDNAFLPVGDNPLSTFSIDVDTASYSNMRRFITQNHRLPPKSAVRIEEMLNYFSYDYPQPEGDVPFSANAEVAECPWNVSHRLVRIGLKGREIASHKRPPSNLVFLVDVSGSMNEPNKLPLVKQSLRMLSEQLTENDRVAIVVYAGNSGLVLPSTTGNNRETIMTALDRLEAGGSTNGGQGIQLAYEIALGKFIAGGTNRVILATDGDFNVGITDRAQLMELIEQQAKSGVFLTTLGYGFGNLKDGTLEQLADKGNGNYAYIDDVREAKKVFVEQMSGTLITIAKDVKIQIEFNPSQVGSFRLVGYENRILAHQDFNNDAKDAGDIGAGHTVTALYEIVPPAANDARPVVDPLKYQQQNKLSDKASSGELLTLKLRYKQPEAKESKLLEYPVKDSGHRYGQATRDFKFAAAVAAFGMLLRDSPHKGTATMAGALELAQEGQGSDEKGYRQEFVSLIQQARAIYDATHPATAPILTAPKTDGVITHAGPVPVAGEPVGDVQPLSTGDALLIEWGGSWWQGMVVDSTPNEKPDGNIKIHYGGWESQWDEVVPRSRLRK